MIGIFDSGVGGLTVVKALEYKMPSVSYCYLGDTAHYPYGPKSKETLEQYSIANTKFLLGEGATTIVVACNTASALALPALKRAFPAIPIFDVIIPAVEHAAKISKGIVGVLATRGTVGSGVYEKALHACRRDITVVSAVAPLLVPLIEEGWMKKVETKSIVRAYCEPLRRANVDTVILGCTHYPLLKSVIASKLRRAKIVDSGEAAGYTLAQYFEAHPEGAPHPNPPKRTFYFTDLTPHVEAIAGRFLGRPVKIEKLSLS